LPFTVTVSVASTTPSGPTSVKTMFPVGKYPSDNVALSVRVKPTNEVVVVRLGLAAETIVASVATNVPKVTVQVYWPATGPLLGNRKLPLG